MAVAPAAARRGPPGGGGEEGDPDNGGESGKRRRGVREGLKLWLSAWCLASPRARIVFFRRRTRPNCPPRAIPAPAIHTNTGAPAPAAAPAAATNEAGGGFAFWVDEILWSQGKVAVELIEEALEAAGGRRAGGPPKPQRGGAGGGAAAAAAEGAGGEAKEGGDAAPSASGSEQPDGAETAAAAPPQRGPAGAAAAIAAAVAARLGLGGAAGAGAAAAASSSGAAPGERADEADLGYRHVPEWSFLWTKSVYGIKAARAMQSGQVVSAIAGLNSLTMKKRMVATLKVVSRRRLPGCLSRGKRQGGG